MAKLKQFQKLHQQFQTTFRSSLLQLSLTSALLGPFHCHVSFVFLAQKATNGLSKHIILILKLIILSLVVIRLSLFIKFHQFPHPRIHHKQINLVLFEFVYVCSQTRNIGLQLLDYRIWFSMQFAVNLDTPCFRTHSFVCYFFSYFQQSLPFIEFALHLFVTCLFYLQFLLIFSHILSHLDFVCVSILFMLLIHLIFCQLLLINGNFRGLQLLSQLHYCLFAIIYVIQHLLLFLFLLFDFLPRLMTQSQIVQPVKTLLQLLFDVIMPPFTKQLRCELFLFAFSCLQMNDRPKCSQPFFLSFIFDSLKQTDYKMLNPTFSQGKSSDSAHNFFLRLRQNFIEYRCENPNLRLTMIELINNIVSILLSIIAYCQKSTLEISLAFCFQQFKAHSSHHESTKHLFEMFAQNAADRVAKEKCGFLFVLFLAKTWSDSLIDRSL